MAYRKLIENLTRSVNAVMDLISTRYNFDLGDEFEIGLCELLTQLLPEQYGVCRGFAVTADGQSAGDDILIYARDRFPTLRMLKQQDFARKQEIPVEAVYAYIEAKHTLMMKEPASAQSLAKAIKQVSDIKKLPREQRSRLAIDPYTILKIKGESKRPNWPTSLNPMFGMIISRYVKETTTINWVLDREAKVAFELEKSDVFPDLIVLGQDHLLVPVINNGTQIRYESPFFIEEFSQPAYREAKGQALATGLITLLYALDTIRLDKMPYRAILGEQLGIIHSPSPDQS